MADQDWRAWAERKYKEKMTGDRFKLTPGRNIVRVLPRLSRVDGKLMLGGIWAHEWQVHYGVGPNNRTMTCGHDVQGGGKCWLCDEQIPKLAQSSKPQLRARAAALAPKMNFTVQIAYVDDSGEWGGPKRWDVPTGSKNSIDAQLFGLFKNPSRDWLSVTKGYNIHIERTGTGFHDTRYGTILASQEPSAVPKAILMKMKTFEELVSPYNEEKMQAAYYGREEIEAEDMAEVDAYESVGAAPESTWDEGLADAEAFSEGEAEPETVEELMLDETTDDVSVEEAEPAAEEEVPWESESEPAAEPSEDESEDFDALFADLKDAPAPAPAPAPKAAAPKAAPKPAPKPAPKAAAASPARPPAKPTSQPKSPKPATATASPVKQAAATKAPVKAAGNSQLKPATNNKRK